MRPRLSEILRGSVRAEVSGAAPQRLLNAMSEADMPFWDAVPQDAFTIRLGLYSRDLRDAKALATRCQCELKLLRESGAPVVKRRLRRRVRRRFFRLFLFPKRKFHDGIIIAY